MDSTLLPPGVQYPTIMSPWLGAISDNTANPGTQSRVFHAHYSMPAVCAESEPCSERSGAREVCRILSIARWLVGE